MVCRCDCNSTERSLYEYDIGGGGNHLKIGVNLKLIMGKSQLI